MDTVAAAGADGDRGVRMRWPGDEQMRSRWRREGKTGATGSEPYQAEIMITTLFWVSQVGHRARHGWAEPIWA